MHFGRQPAGTGLVSVTYLVLTAALLATVWYAAQYFGSPMYFSIWIWSLALLTLTQIVFLVIAIRQKYRLVLWLSALVLLGLAGFVFLLATMPS